tara:strand:+ start:285 stop:470 length:186 start_codon:yes stop_codon:yes gene_type:complete
MTNISESRNSAEMKVPLQSKFLMESSFPGLFLGSGVKINIAMHIAKMLNIAIKMKMALHPK